jgi:hypothetical protein
MLLVYYWWTVLLYFKCLPWILTGWNSFHSKPNNVCRLAVLWVQVSLWNSETFTSLQQLLFPSGVLVVLLEKQRVVWSLTWSVCCIKGPVWQKRSSDWHHTHGTLLLLKCLWCVIFIAMTISSGMLYYEMWYVNTNLPLQFQFSPTTTQSKSSCFLQYFTFYSKLLLVFPVNCS